MPSKWPRVENPVPGREAFSRTDPAAVLSQAAVLLSLGAQSRGDEETFAARARAAGLTENVEFWPAEDSALFGRPRLTAPAGRLDIQRVQQGLAGRYGEWVLPRLPKSQADVTKGVAKALPELGPLAYDQATADAGAELMEVCLNHSEQLLRVASAASYFEMSTESERLIGILTEGCGSDDELVRELAATALWHVSPEHVVLNSLKARGGRAAASASGNTTLLVHGTWAASSSWWQPHGDFHDYILNNVRSDLYSQSDCFGWSGDYSDSARAQAAVQLANWVSAHNDAGLDLITHSHGGNVAMLGTHSGLQIGELILLSCPVHFPKYLPDFSQIRKAVSIRVHLDLVILADRGGQKFKLSQIQENVLPVWFDHQATHDPATWDKYNVKSRL